MANVDEAVRHELDRRSRDELRRSLQRPHVESVALAEQGLAQWTRSLPSGLDQAVVDSSAGKPVRWIPGEGWVDESEFDPTIGNEQRAGSLHSMRV